MRKKNVIQRVQSQVGLSFAEGKSLRLTAEGKANFRPMARLVTILALLLTAATGVWAQQTYTVQLPKSTEDAANWTIYPAEATTTGVGAGTAVSATYSGSLKVQSVTAELLPAYLKWDATQKIWVEKPIPSSFTKVVNSNSDVNWQAGTYVVDGDVTIVGTISLQGNVELIIKDGAKLTVNGAITGNGNSLSVYGQAGMSGELAVTLDVQGAAINWMTALNIHSCKVNARVNVIGSNGFFNITTINVYGGSVDAECTDSDGCGIELSQSLNIYGGEVKAVGHGADDTYSYGIKSVVSTGAVNVYGGKLWAECADNKAFNGNSVTLTVDADYATGKVQTSSDGENWTDYTGTDTPDTPYVRVGY